MSPLKEVDQPVRGAGIQPFFEIAATLIPLLLFGGIFINRDRPTGREVLDHPFRQLTIPLLAIFAIIAEMFAIRGAVLGEASTIERIFVFGTIIAGMLAISFSASMPVLEAVRHDFPFLKEKRHLERLSAFAILLAGVAGVVILWQAVDVSDYRADADGVNTHLRALNRCLVVQERAVASRGQKAAALSAQLAHVPPGDRNLRRALNQSIDFQTHLARVALDQQTRCLQEFNRVAREFPD